MGGSVGATKTLHRGGPALAHVVQNKVPATRGFRATQLIRNRQVPGKRRCWFRGRANPLRDIVVKLDRARERIVAIGGNVRGTMVLKLLPAASAPGKGFHPIGWTRPLFAHLKLRAAPSEADAFDGSPTIRAVRYADGFRVQARLAAAHVLPAGPRPTRC